MYAHYFYWQYIAAPVFLLRFMATLQRMLLQMFSVRVMLTTLFAHWHRDRIVLSQGSISGIGRALMLNAISRAVGFAVRASILCIWLVAEAIFLVLSAGTVAAFLAAPIAAVLAIVYGVALLGSGG